MFGAKEGRLSIAGGEVDYIVFGKGTKPLVMIQGLNTRGIRGAGAGLAWMYRCFARDYRVWLFDRKQPLRPGISIRELAEDLAASLDAVGISSACVLGVSQGGMMAQYLAAQRPDLVEKLVLAVTACRSNEVMAQALGTWTALTREQNWKALTADMARRMYSPAYMKRYESLLPLLALVQKPRDPERFLNLAQSCLDFDADALHEQIRCPVLVLGGARDQVVGSGSSEELAGKLGCRMHIYEQLGHAAYEEAPDFNQRVLGFFRG